jgi:hypothetical protein
MGAWKGILEPSLTIEIAILSTSPVASISARAEVLAYDIKDLNKQEAVLVEYIESHNILI